MLAFGLGTTCSLMLFAYRSCRAQARQRQRWSVGAVYAKPSLGGALVLVGLLVLTSRDKRIEALTLKAMPAWLVDFTTTF